MREMTPGFRGPATATIDDQSHPRPHLGRKLSEEVISLRRMGWPLRIFTVLTCLLVVGAAVALAAGSLPQPQIGAGWTQNRAPLQVPLSVILAVPCLLLPATVFALTGALSTHPALRYAVAALILLVLGAAPVNALDYLTAQAASGPSATLLTLHQAQLALLGLVALWTIFAPAWRSRFVQGASARPPRAWLVSEMLVTALLLAGYYACEAVIWWTFRASGNLAGGNTALGIDFGIQAWLLPLFLTLVLYWASTDLAEWGLSLGGALSRWLDRWGRVWPLWTLTALSAAAMVVDVLLSDHLFIEPSLVLVAAMAATVVVVARYAHIDDAWPTHLPTEALIVGAIFLYATNGFGIIISIAPIFKVLFGLGVGRAYDVGTMINFGVTLAGLFGGLWLIARGRAPERARLGVYGLFLFLVALVTAFSNLPDTLTVLGDTTSRPPYYTLDAVRFCAAVGVLLFIFWLLGQRRPGVSIATPLGWAFTLLAGLQGISWLLNYSALLGGLGTLPVVATAGLLMIAILWDLITSGREVTNGDSPAFPHAGRVLLYLGYTLSATASLLYFGAQHLQGFNSAPPGQYGVDVQSNVGLQTLGVPLVVLTCVLGLIPWLRANGAVAAAPAASALARGPQRMLIAGGVTLTLYTLIIVVGVVPTLNAASPSPVANQAYIALAPGKGCDPGGALWLPSTGAEVMCSPRGLQITAAPHAFASVQFVPPEGQGLLPLAYSIGVHVHFAPASGAKGGQCADIITRATKTSSTENMLCANGAYVIQHYDIPGQRGFFETQLRQAPAGVDHNIYASVTGQAQFMAIDASTPVVGPDTPHVFPEFIGLEVLNFSDQPETALFSDFIYLPSHALIRSTIKVARPTVPKPAAGFRTYIAPSGTWGANVPTSSSMIPGSLTIGGLSAKSYTFPIGDTSACTVYEIPKVLGPTDVQSLAQELAGSFGATDMKVVGAVTPTQVGREVWQYVRVTATENGVPYTLDLLFQPHGIGTIVIALAAPTAMYTDTVKQDFVPIVRSFTILA